MPEQRAHRGFRLVLTPEEGREAGGGGVVGCHLGFKSVVGCPSPPSGSVLVRARSPPLRVTVVPWMAPAPVSWHGSRGRGLCPFRANH